MFKRRWALGGLLLGGVLGSAGWLRTPFPATTPTAEAKNRIEEVLSTIRAHYIGRVDEKDLYLGAVQGAVERLRDPYSVLLLNDDYRSLKESLEGTYGGVGLQLERRDGAIVVVDIEPGSPAERGGLRSGDRLVSVNDRLTDDWTTERATTALRGREGSLVRLLIERPGQSQYLRSALVRTKLHVPAVGPSVLLEPGLGYVALKRLSKGTASELYSAIAGLYATGMRSLVLDLRSNPGGLLNEAVAVAELFLTPPQVIAMVRGRDTTEATRPERQCRRAPHDAAAPTATREPRRCGRR
jgi:carboxyl-terminal processing protease